MTMRERILTLLGGSNNQTFAATQICQIINNDDANNKKLRLSSVSSVLVKMIADEQLEKVENFGPRGGNGYRMRIR